MKYIIGFIVATIFWYFVLTSIPIQQEEFKVYDCRIAEIHPDYPPEVKEECRRRFRNYGITT